MQQDVGVFKSDSPTPNSEEAKNQMLGFDLDEPVMEEDPISSFDRSSDYDGDNNPPR